MSEDQPTVQGTSWPIVLFAEVTGERAKDWVRALEEANIIVLVEPSIVRAAMIARREKPHVVVVPASLPSERTEGLREGAREAGAVVLTLSLELSASQVTDLVGKSLKRR